MDIVQFQKKLKDLSKKAGMFEVPLVYDPDRYGHILVLESHFYFSARFNHWVKSPFCLQDIISMTYEIIPFDPYSDKYPDDEPMESIVQIWFHGGEISITNYFTDYHSRVHVGIENRKEYLESIELLEELSDKGSDLTVYRINLQNGGEKETDV